MRLVQGNLGSGAPERAEFVRRTVIVVALLGLGALLWYAADVFLLGFAGIMLAVFLAAAADWLSAVAHWRRGWSLTVVISAIVLALCAVGWLAIPKVAAEIQQLAHILPGALERLQNYLHGRSWGRTVLQYLPSALASANLTGHIGGLATSAMEGLAGIVLVAVVGLYVSANPSIYEGGVVKLFSVQNRERARIVLCETGYALRWWIFGQIVPMVVLGIATVIGLWLLGVHLPVSLGIFTGLMIFIPYLGALIALAVTVLITVIQGPAAVLHVFLLFIGIHIAEGYLLTPLVQKRAVYLPPGLTIFSQVLMGLILGFSGLALATPLTAVVLVLVKMLYLHETPEHHVWGAGPLKFEKPPER